MVVEHGEALELELALGRRGIAAAEDVVPHPLQERPEIGDQLLTDRLDARGGKIPHPLDRRRFGGRTAQRVGRRGRRHPVEAGHAPVGLLQHDELVVGEGGPSAELAVVGWAAATGVVGIGGIAEPVDVLGDGPARVGGDHQHPYIARLLRCPRSRVIERALEQGVEPRAVRRCRQSLKPTVVAAVAVGRRQAGDHPRVSVRQPHVRRHMTLLDPAIGPDPQQRRPVFLRRPESIAAGHEPLGVDTIG